jgi:zinc protease
MELESDRFQTLWYEEEAFKTESGAVYGEYRKSVSSAGFVLYETLMNTAFDKHTYKHTTIGFENDIKAMPTMYEYSKAFFKAHYRPENVVVLVVGDVKSEPVLALAKKYYSGWEKGYVEPPIPVEPEQTAARSAKAAFDGKTLPMVIVGYKSPAYKPGDVMPVACQLLGDLAFGETSDIYKKLVLDDQRVQYVQGGSDLSRDPELFTVNTMVKDPNDIAAVEEEIYKTIELFRTTPVDAQKLADVKSNTKYGYLMRLETPAGVARSLIGQLAVTGTMKSVDTYYATLNAVTPQDIMDAAKTILVPEKRTVVVVEGN